jgi:hypothetical protein
MKHDRHDKDFALTYGNALLLSTRYLSSKINVFIIVISKGYNKVTCVYPAPPVPNLIVLFIDLDFICVSLPINTSLPLVGPSSYS